MDNDLDQEMNDDFNADVADSDNQTSISNDTIIERFISSKKEVCRDDYNNLLHCYIECESISKGNGIKRIVACVFAMNLSSDYSTITYEEAFYHLKATLFCYSLTSKQISQFTDISHMMGHIYYSPQQHVSTSLKSSPPSSNKGIQRYYLKTNTAIANNIPIPNIIENHNHAFISIKEALQHFLCFESNIDGMFIDNATTSFQNIVSTSSLLTKTEMSNIICETVRQKLRLSTVYPLIIYIIIWSDDFEPNNVKQHKKFNVD